MIKDEIDEVVKTMEVCHKNFQIIYTSHKFQVYRKPWIVTELDRKLFVTWTLWSLIIGGKGISLWKTVATFLKFMMSEMVKIHFYWYFCGILLFAR